MFIALNSFAKSFLDFNLSLIRNLSFIGSCGLLWFLLWIFFIYETPSTHPTITSAERKYIESEIGQSDIANIPKVRLHRILKCLIKMK